MDYEINRAHAKILFGFIFVAAIFSYALITNYQNDSLGIPNSLVGYVVFEGGTKVSTEKLDSALVEEIRSGNSEPKVVVVLKDNSETTSADLEKRKEAIQETQQAVIENLKDKVEVSSPEDKKEIASSSGSASQEEIQQEIEKDKLPDSAQIILQQEAGFEVTQKFYTVNAIAGKVNNPEALVELTKNRNVKQILLDYPVQVNLDQSVPRINAPSVWGTMVNGTNITGAGETVCVIDTGIDYTHPALGGCAPVSFELNGNIESLAEPFQSEHPYIDNLDYTWTITKTNYAHIAVHFTNISLETLGGGDSLDRVYIYDKNNNTLAIYKESLTDIWSPYGDGDTIYVRLVSDGSITSYGFLIDQVINGTTNATMNWNACPKVIGGWDTYNNDADPKDDHGHGTHVAGIIASANETYRGVAPDAKLIAIKALNSAGAGYSSDVLAGIEWCNQNADKYNISIISMSLGCDGFSCPHYQTHCNDDLTASAISLSYSKNISVFIAAGNSGWADGISNPACVEHAIPVGGANDADAIAYNRGNLLHIIAPASNIQSSTLSNSWTSYSGTSMATPHAAGAAALLHQYWQLAYGTIPTPEQIQNKLMLSGKKINDASSGLNFSRIDVLAAIKPILSFSNNTPANETTINIGTNNINTNNTNITNITNNILIEMNSDVPLSDAILEWGYSNGSAFNTTMNAFSPIQYYFNQTVLSNGTNYYLVYGTDMGGVTGISEKRIIYINITTNVTTNASTNTSTNETFNNTNSTSNNIIFNISIVSPQNNSYYNSNFYINLSLSISAYNLSNETEEHAEELKINTLNYNLTANGFNNTNVTDANITNANLTNASGNVMEYFNNSINASLINIIYFVNLSLLNLTNGNYTLALFANDTNGNNFNAKYNIIIDFNTSNANSSDSTLANTLIITSPASGSVIELGSLILFNAATNLTGNQTYSWNFGDRTNAAGLSASKQYNKTGNYTIILTALNASNNLTSSLANITLAVNDTLPPNITSLSYLTEVHLGRDKTQRVTATLFDYSNLSSVQLYHNNATITLSNSSNYTSNNISNYNYFWNISSLAVGNNTFTIEAIDNFTVRHAQNFTYNFSVTSCSDRIKNGDETEIDCGGSCANCTANATTTAEAAVETASSTTSTTTPVTETSQTEESQLTTSTTPSTPLKATAAAAAPINWTSGLKESSITQKEKTLYLLGGVLILLLGLYTLLVWKNN